MKHPTTQILIAFVVGLLLQSTLTLTFDLNAAEPDLGRLCTEFERYSGAQLVFFRENLPPGKYYDILKPLTDARKAKAAEICVAEVRKFPRGYLRKIGLSTIGVFAACVNKTGDRFHTFDKKLGGYRYLGIYNKSDAIAIAFYGEGQLPLTFHHELFHHVDSTREGITESWQLSSDDARHLAAISGIKPRSAPQLSKADLRELRKRSRGEVVRDSVSLYANRNPREDQAETARHLMSAMPDALLQTVEQPDLAGSQRILHIIEEYQLSIEDGPGFEWFVDVALSRTPSQEIERLASDLRRFIDSESVDKNEIATIRESLDGLLGFDSDDLDPGRLTEVTELAARVTYEILSRRTRANNDQTHFTVWGREEIDGANWTLRDDLSAVARDGDRLKKIVGMAASPTERTLAYQLKTLRMVARYYQFVGLNWSISPGTDRTFYAVRNSIVDSLPKSASELKRILRKTPMGELATKINEQGRANLDVL